MPGRCPKCGSAILKRKSKRGYAYYACERGAACGFMTWDVPTDQDCPVCGQTMFKRSGKGAMKPFCANPECSNFLPEDRRGYRRKSTATGEAATAESNAEAAAEAAQKQAEEKKAAKKAAAKKPTEKAAAKKPAAKKTAAKSLRLKNQLPKKLPKRPSRKTIFRSDTEIERTSQHAGSESDRCRPRQAARLRGSWLSAAFM